MPNARSPNLSWYFLFPEYGVAVGIRDGTAISWDGRVVGHCTSVPRGLHASDALLSLFVGRYERVEHAHARRHEMQLALACMHAARGARTFRSIIPDEVVWVRWPTDDGGWRRATATLVRWTDAGEALVRWSGQHGGARGTTTTFDAQFAADCIVRAGAIAEVPDELTGASLIGRRVRAYFPAMDELYAGKVTAWCDGVHRVEYDDGDVSTWSLYWPSGAPGFVLES
mmetsp:Transcript_5721/g.15228  ORF Transcript_5721/g.15228 Transcript_5721/m.15228 type:complete len:227 (+) Transcript_5721:712-1392(+)